VVNGMTDAAREGGSVCARWHEVDGEGAWVRRREGDERQRQRQRQRQMDARARRHMQVNEHEVPTLWVATGIPIPML